MARSKKGRPISGWVVFDKPYDLGSTEAVSLVRRLFGAQKAGHAGTLDPLATGLLPIALGEATKTVPYIMEAPKVYRFDVCWGHETTTDDLEGEPTNHSPNRPDKASIEAALGQFIGTIEQIPPIYSAIRVNGQRAYDLARNGYEAELPPRSVTIERFDLLAQDDENHATFEVACSKGTYIRSLARDLARALNTYGHVSALRRSACGVFDEAESITLEALLQLASEGQPALDEALMPIESALRGCVEIRIDSGEANRLRLGQALLLRGRNAPIEADEAYAINGDDVIALGFIEQGMFNPRRIICSV